ncbi:hypothetical protein CFP56_028243 [Quercus suber]|uniref:Uncharacterized protein n=1 Tax=Quercus suber TaxID=58331 RepID=A0AAW0LY84_QUESU
MYDTLIYATDTKFRKYAGTINLEILTRNFFPIIKVPESSITRTAEFGLRLTDSFLKLNDVGGLETCKEALIESTIWAKKYPQFFTSRLIDAAKVWKLMGDWGIKKEPGCRWIDEPKLGFSRTLGFVAITGSRIFCLPIILRKVTVKTESPVLHLFFFAAPWWEFIKWTIMPTIGPTTQTYNYLETTFRKLRRGRYMSFSLQSGFSLEKMV